ncbi:acyl-CoA dehydrogenase family protein [Polymorphum gilvum]|uniref:Acyl-CoA dehydrogenase domain protein n=1 Tax=Polymorphum gilvum (strain LMG 25793 / CGMCC 1.9160 / SL003B-26A1) TaxID=991905 RepID=F2IYU8_POLGS|nr:acyl-CoA dehydrogenase family protein [Polymorphum gilvum]ADZ70563.1 Acyl-CoA dehydrogenase domain protein [Polymorphum gilvum SL003B-26A1]
MTPHVQTVAQTQTPAPALMESLPSSDGPAAMIDRVARIARSDLAPLVHDIDLKGVYPESVMRALGAAGAYAHHAPMTGVGSFDLETAIRAMSTVGEQCLSTAFCVWCQDALAWYVANSANDTLKATLGPKLLTGEALGGTGLSNPMKTLFGIEKLRLKGERVAGGFSVTGMLPWVSNLGEDHHFGMIFSLPGEGDRMVMAVTDCAGDGVRIVANDEFVALDGTRTFAVQLRNAFIPDSAVLADPIDDYIPRIRAGFILLQAGMAFGLIRNCIDLMDQAGASLGHVNCFLPDQPGDFREQLDAFETEVYALCRTPFETSTDYFVRVVKARLAAGDASVAAAHNAMLHCGARGYVKRGAAQRRLREAYFVAIVTPATKQLRKMLADLGAA